MMRVRVHIGLAVLVALAPALCCCNVAWLSGRAIASPVVPCPACEEAPAASPQSPAPEQPSCCRHDAPSEAARGDAPADLPQSSPPTRCKCCVERSDAALPVAPVTAADAEPASELLPPAANTPAAIPPEHLGLLCGLDPPERAGVDARSEALFARHVLRC